MERIAVSSRIQTVRNNFTAVVLFGLVRRGIIPAILCAVLVEVEQRQRQAPALEEGVNSRVHNNSPEEPQRARLQAQAQAQAVLRRRLHPHRPLHQHRPLLRFRRHRSREGKEPFNRLFLLRHPFNRVKRRFLRS